MFIHSNRKSISHSGFPALSAGTFLSLYSYPSSVLLQEPFWAFRVGIQGMAREKEVEDTGCWKGLSPNLEGDETQRYKKWIGLSWLLCVNICSRLWPGLEDKHH